jgi:hypothetical protein
MLVSEILWATRNDYLHDIKIPYLWSDEELLRHLNRTYPELCRETGVIQEVSVTAITQIPILSGQHTYAMDSRILEIHNPVHAIFYDPTTGNPTETLIDVKDIAWVDENIPYWRTQMGEISCIIPDYGQGFLRIVRYPDPETTGYFSGAFTFVASSKTIGQVGANFSTYLVAGDHIVVSGTTLNGTTAIPKTFTIVLPGIDSTTVSETVVNETVTTGGIIQKVQKTLYLTVSRLPVQTFTIGDVDTQSPEIRADFHSYLIDGILREAYMKQDSECLDKEKADDHRRIFEENKHKIKLAMNWLRVPPQRVKPYYGSL